MLVNKLVAQNMSVEINGIIQKKVDNSNLRLYIAEIMLNWVEPIDKTIVYPLVSLLGTSFFTNWKNVFCVVWKVAFKKSWSLDT